jgi:hypothetical protein
MGALRGQPFLAVLSSNQTSHVYDGYMAQNASSSSKNFSPVVR